ncbi:MAG TPA: AAA family ATPase [Tepidisphaeraceae bacterium]|nr:AAA family ATPase [Tepidisphaeraceae bacterium]
MDIRIDEGLLARAVDVKIRPLLIDEGHLGNVKSEGYQHLKVIPKAQPLLSRRSLEADAVEAVSAAINASFNLLSQFEKAKSKALIALPAVAGEVGPRVTELLYGAAPLVDRVRAFLKWGAVRKLAGGREGGFNGTTASYLLAMSDPARYAFCKPEVYSAAARALLGDDHVEDDPAVRLGHATAFYAAALPILRDRYRLPFADLMHCHIAFYVVEKYTDDGWPDWEQLKDRTAPVPRPAPPRRSHPLNLILYGPPGTGKTWHTIRRAVEVCDGELPADPAAVHRRFGELREASRIELVTFHQSYGYEEFVEGIRPVLIEPGNAAAAGLSAAAGHGDVRYELRDGVFKRIASLARGSGTVARRATTDVDLVKQQVWKVSLGNTMLSEEDDVYDQSIQAGEIRLGYGKGLDFAGCDDREAILARLRKKEPHLEPTDYNVQSMHSLKNKMRVGDLVVVSDGNHAFRAIGKVTGEYRRTADDDYNQVRDVQWLLVLDQSLPVERILHKVFSQATIYQLKERVLRVDALRELLSGNPSPPENHVLVIDEINRGNISKVFGELITLVEPDKRIGAANELRVTLPYSGQAFGVPANLYLVGTMNTADRSIAFLDTALRRRFRFEEMMPDPVVVRTAVGTNGVVGGVDVAALLEAVNRRIELLFDRDHQIGHAYFLGVQTLADLRDVFEYQVIPLLQEYFYGDWAKVCAVLGCPHDPTTGRPLTGNPLPLIAVDVLDGAVHAGAWEDGAEPRFRYDLNPEVYGGGGEPALRTCFDWVLGDASSPSPVADGDGE